MLWKEERIIGEEREGKSKPEKRRRRRRRRGKKATGAGVKGKGTPMRLPTSLSPPQTPSSLFFSPLMPSLPPIFGALSPPTRKRHVSHTLVLIYLTLFF